MWDDKLTGKTVGMALDDAALKYGDKVATVYHNGAVTYNQLKQTSDLIARGFLNLGIGKGDKIAIWMAGYSEWAFVYFALMRIGAVIVPVNTRYRPEEIAYVLNKSKAALLVFKEERNKDYLSLLKELCPGAGEKNDALPNEKLPDLSRIIVSSSRSSPGWLSFDALKALGAEVPEGTLRQAEGKVGADDIAMIQFTSGTTAMPKGAMLFQAAMLRGAQCGCLAAATDRGRLLFQPSTLFPRRRIDPGNAHAGALGLHDDRAALFRCRRSFGANGTSSLQRVDGPPAALYRISQPP